MNHPDESIWRAYADGSLPGPDRERAEAHLELCDECLTVYISVLEQETDGVAALEAGTAEAVAGRAMAEITALASGRTGNASGAAAASSKRRPARRNRRKQTFIHYMIAVCVMLLLMSAGMFDRLAVEPQKWESERRGREPVSASLMEKTSQMIGAIVDQTDGTAKRDQVK